VRDTNYTNSNPSLQNMQDHNSGMKTTSYTQNQAIQNQVHIIRAHNTVHKQAQNIIMLSTSRYI